MGSHNVSCESISVCITEMFLQIKKKNWVKQQMRLRLENSPVTHAKRSRHYVMTCSKSFITIEIMQKLITKHFAERVFLHVKALNYLKTGCEGGCKKTHVKTLTQGLLHNNIKNINTWSLASHLGLG